MANPQTIQRVPSGLLELLGMKGTGQTPPVLASELAGVVDTTQMYLRSVLSSQSIVNAAAVLATAVDITVPDNQYWILRGAYVRLQPAAGCTALAAALQIGNIGTIIPVAWNEFSTFGTNFVMSLPWQPPQPWILAPGDFLRGNINALAGAASVNLGLTVQFGLIQ